MFIRIYFDTKPLFLCNEVDDTILPYIHHDDAIFIDELDSHTIKTMIHEMQQDNVQAGVFFHPDLEKLKTGFFKKFTRVIAAGGLVQNEKNELLLIHRRGKWDLPKGKLDTGESLEKCATREVEEETGLKNVRLLEPLTVTYHTYHEGTHFILKESHWFTMSVSGNQQLVPQKEEDINEIRWVNPNELPAYMNDTFPSVTDVLKRILT